MPFISLLNQPKTNLIFYKTEEEIERIREACLLVCKVLAHVGANIKPGMKGSKLDREAEELIRDHGATPAFKGYVGAGSTKAFPYTLCVSINEVVVHGIPSDETFFGDGDIDAVLNASPLGGDELVVLVAQLDDDTAKNRGVEREDRAGSIAHGR